jgi:(p)ppGpp synthase/HD superfamily hydrolase
MLSLEQAITLAAEAHAGQTDKAGVPYILHLLRVMQAQNSKEAMMVGVLHDLVEDTGYILDDLREQGCPSEVIAALRHVTRKDKESYAEFIERIGRHPIARQVKLADLKDNMDVTRLESVTEKDTERLRKYHQAYQQLITEGKLLSVREDFPSEQDHSRE